MSRAVQACRISNQSFLEFTPQVLNTYNPVNNQVSSSTLSSATLTAGSYIYDASGNTLFDGNNQYWYDAEGQLCAEQSLRSGGSAIYQYVYDAEGARIAKGTLASAPSSYTATCAPPLGTGFTLTNRYLVDLGGDQVTEMNGAGVWQHSNIWAGGKLVATYDTKGLHFDLSDPLGTKRVQANATGSTDEYCTSLPFGNDINNPVSVNCTPVANALNTADDATEHHFTQKERDTETGNDYFLARYYSPALGRFTTPDWNAKEDPVPYAALNDPQSLNLYSYVKNRTLNRIDYDGHSEFDFTAQLKGKIRIRIPGITITVTAGFDWPSWLDPSKGSLVAMGAMGHHGFPREPLKNSPARVLFG